IATSALASLSGVMPDFVLPPGMLAAKAGRVCYFVNAPQQEGQQTGVIDCVAFGAFACDNGSFGSPPPVTPDDRSLQRASLTGVNRNDWTGVLTPTPQNDAADAFRLPTLCGDGLVSQGEECDGTALGGKTCASLGFATGTLSCVQCHIDASQCSACGNGAINANEECDGAD